MANLESNGFSKLNGNNGSKVQDGGLTSTFKAEAGTVGGNSYMGENNHETQVKTNDKLMGAKYLKPGQ